MKNETFLSILLALGYSASFSVIVGCQAGQVVRSAELAGLVEPRIRAATDPLKEQLAELPEEQELSLEQMMGIGGSVVAGMFGLNQVRNHTRKKALEGKG